MMMGSRDKDKRKGGGLVAPPPPRPVPRLVFPVAPLGRKWLKIDAEGKSLTVATDRHKLTHELGVQTRDLRVLDPKFSTNYPSAILCREHAIVVNLFHIKTIVTRDHVLVVNPDSQDAELGRFVKALETRLGQSEVQTSASFPVLSNFLGQKKSGRHKDNETKNYSRKQTVNNTDGSDNQSAAEKQEDNKSAASEQRNHRCVLPFELKALEVCLESICTLLDSNTTQLEGTAFPAVDDLTLNITTKNLQRVRVVKSKIAQLKTRVETVKEILEKFLDDDDDMRDLNLTAKTQQHRSCSLSPDLMMPTAFNGLQITEGGTPQHRRSSSSSSNSSDIDEAVQEVEMLLEAYFMQLDNILNRLLTMNEYIDDTEDFINIVQDKHRNQLLQLELIITAGTFALTIVAVVSGIFGMNLNNSFSEESSKPFILVTCLSLFVATTVLFIILWFCRLKGMMAI